MPAELVDQEVEAVNVLEVEELVVVDDEDTAKLPVGMLVTDEPDD